MGSFSFSFHRGCLREPQGRPSLNKALRKVQVTHIQTHTKTRIGQGEDTYTGRKTPPGCSFCARHYLKIQGADGRWVTVRALLSLSYPCTGKKHILKEMTRRMSPANDKVDGQLQLGWNWLTRKRECLPYSIFHSAILSSYREIFAPP